MGSIHGDVYFDDQFWWRRKIVFIDGIDRKMGTVVNEYITCQVVAVVEVQASLIGENDVLFLIQVFKQNLE